MRLHASCMVSLLICTASSALAQTAGMVSFQGLIRDSGGTPIVTPVSLEFRIFTADTGGTLVDMDGDGTVESTAAAPGGGTDVILVGPLSPNGGIVSTKFGPVSPKAFAGLTPGGMERRWLEVTVVGSGALSRIEMVAPPGAAEQVNKLMSGDAAMQTAANGNVGIGTTTPGGKLHIRSVGATAVFQCADQSNSCDVLWLDPDDTPAFFKWALSYEGNNLGDGLTLYRDGGVSAIPTMAWKYNGNVGIGTTTPTEKLTVAGGYILATGQGANTGFRTASHVMNEGTDSFFHIDDATFTIASGNVGIGTATPTQQLDVAGNVRCNSVIQTSTRVFKNNIRPIVGALSHVLSLSGVAFDWDASHGGAPDLGLIAEDVATVLPEIVSCDEFGRPNGLKYDHLVAVTIEAIKEQQTTIERQKAEVTALHSEVHDLKQRLARIESSLEAQKDQIGDQ